MSCPKCGVKNDPIATNCFACDYKLKEGDAVIYGTQQNPYAGFWRRFLAYSIDSFILGIVGGILGIIISLASGFFFSLIGVDLDLIRMITLLVSCLVFFLINLFYFAIMESSLGQATYGKKALGMYVTDLNGDRISFGRAIGRYFGKMISGLFLNIGFIMAAFTLKKQALHDMMAGTLVVRN